ncbi:unnamed protein product [Paramecium sonneborni]|uniref:Uncharacterized protein n=1 Tax=Paramecium sonneborni TaxID=65129 RepID=A0A8S1KDN0_9CILI|nr:unnamed protein product [Paramecium sonneborni]
MEKSVYKTINDLSRRLKLQLNKYSQKIFIYNIKGENQQFTKQSFKNFTDQLKFIKSQIILFFLKENLMIKVHNYFLKGNSKKRDSNIEIGTLLEYQFQRLRTQMFRFVSFGITQLYQVKRTNLINLIRYKQKVFKKFQILRTQQFLIILYRHYHNVQNFIEIQSFQLQKIHD